MEDGDYRMPPADLPETVGTGSRKNMDFIHSKSFFESTTNMPLPTGTIPEAPEDRALPPEEVAPDEYIYTEPKKRSWKEFKTKLLGMYGVAAGIAVLLLTNIIPLYHSNSKVLPSGKLKIYSVLTGFAGWQDENGNVLVFQENGTGYTHANGIFAPLVYTGGEEAVRVRMKWGMIEVGQGILFDSGEITIDNENLKADGMSYTLSLPPDGEELLEFRPVNFLSLNTSYLDAFMAQGFSGLFADTEWAATTGGVEEMIPAPVYTKTLRFGKAGPESGTLYAEGIFAAAPAGSGESQAVIDEPTSYTLLFREEEPDGFGQAFFFHAEPDHLPVQARYTVNDSHHLMESEGSGFEGTVLVTEEGYRLSWLAPFDHFRTYGQKNGSLFPDDPSGPGGDADPTEETEEPTEEPKDVFATLTGVPGWVSDDGAYYSFKEDGTGWVFSNGYFGTMSFEGDESFVDLATILVSEDLSYSDEKGEMISSVTKHETYHTLTPDAFQEEDGVMTVMLGVPDTYEDVLFRPTDTLPDTQYLDLFLEKGFVELNYLGYWFIVDEYIPESSYPTPYTEFISFKDETSLIFVFNTTEPVQFTSNYAFDVGCGQVDPMTFEFSMHEEIKLEYKPLSASDYSSYTHTQDPKNGYIRIIIKEDGLYVYADVPMGRPNLYYYRQD